MYKRDVGILMLAMAGIYLSIQHEGAFNFRKAWCAKLGDLPVTRPLATLSCVATKQDQMSASSVPVAGISTWMRMPPYSNHMMCCHTPLW